MRHTIWECEDQGLFIDFFLRDNDSCYSKDCDILLKSADIKTVRTPLQAPNANAHAERFILSIKRECLNYLLVFGINRLERIVNEYVSYFNKHRPHQGIGNKIPGEYKNLAELSGKAQSKQMPARQIIRKEFIGGLLKSYQRAA